MRLLLCRLVSQNRYLKRYNRKLVIVSSPGQCNTLYAMTLFVRTYDGTNGTVGVIIGTEERALGPMVIRAIAERDSEIGRALGKHAGSIHGVLAAKGGIVPLERMRAVRSLTFTERESISRGIAADLSVLAIALRQGLTSSTVVRSNAMADCDALSGRECGSKSVG